MIRKMYFFTGPEINSIVRSTTADAALVLLLLSASGIDISMTSEQKCAVFSNIGLRARKNPCP